MEDGRKLYVFGLLPTFFSIFTRRTPCLRKSEVEPCIVNKLATLKKCIRNNYLQLQNTCWTIYIASPFKFWD